MKELVEFSRKYGSDPELVLAGGGNTSMKEKGVLYVKGSGCSLSTIREENFVAMDLAKLLEILDKEYPAEDREREAMFLADVSKAKLPGEENKRPSVEALLHALFPQRYVLHLHPALVNGLTCGLDGEKIAGELFPDAIWVEACRPGYTLAKLLLERLAKRRAEGLATPKQIRLLESRGFMHVGEWSFESASNMISRIAANGWRSAPKGVDTATYVP